MNAKAQQLREQILALTAEYHREAFPSPDYQPGKFPVPVSGKVISDADLCSVVDATLDGWFTSGRFTQAFETAMAHFVGVRGCSLVNSGSSANLLALTALTAPKLGDRRLRPGDEVIYQEMEFRQIGNLPNTDYVMSHVLWLGVFPGLTRPMLDHMVATIYRCCR